MTSKVPPLQKRRESVGLTQQELADLSEKIAKRRNCPIWFKPFGQAAVSQVERAPSIGKRAKSYLHACSIAAAVIPGAVFAADYFTLDAIVAELAETK